MLLPGDIHSVYLTPGLAGRLMRPCSTRLYRKHNSLLLHDNIEYFTVCGGRFALI